MALTTEDRRRVWTGLMGFWSRVRELLGAFDKDGLLDAVGAADDWVDAAQSSYNQALPEPFRSEATADQKALVLVAVIVARQRIQWLRVLFGRVD